MFDMSNFTCPFCLRTYKKSMVKYICPDCGKEVKRKPWMGDKVKCEDGGIASIRSCPKCDKTLPKAALETPNLPFSIVGVSGAGKTNFITVMMKELKNNGLNLTIGGQTTETRNHQNEMERIIYNSYKDNMVPPSTNRDEIFPQIWYVRNNQKGNRNEVPTYTFTIFDGAGESHEDIDPNSAEYRYINASKAIILTIDPLVFSSIVRGGFVDPSVLYNSRGGEVSEKDASEVINGVADYIKSARGISTNKKLDVPVAVVLTKIDTVLSHPAFGSHALIQSSSLNIRNGKVDLTEMQQVDMEIRNWLYTIGEDAFINALNSNFKEYMLFGVSSLGAPPTDVDSFPKEIHPHRILDPILWLFKREKFVS